MTKDFMKKCNCVITAAVPPPSERVRGRIPNSKKNLKSFSYYNSFQDPA